MEERRPPRERELVLAPNEYAYVLDTTKGHINCYVGPNKTSLAQTDQPVMFNTQTKRFDAADDLRDAVALFATAPAGWYMMLKNPARDGGHPKPGLASGFAELDVGRKVVLHGPQSFALWPGQTARVVLGHRLRTNHYLVIHVYDAALANEHPAAVLGTKTAPAGTTFAAGEKRIIRGTDVMSYLPPNGVEVVPDESGTYVRDAVTLQRLEYCVLVGEDGKKKTVRGEAVVFPEPDQRFLDEGGQKRRKAIELSELTGVHVKVISPYVDDDGTARTEGEELFITGRNRIYFPREEHAIIRSPGAATDLHHAIAIPAGEGRYVLNRKTGDIALKRGPLMFLADPRDEVITRRVLTDRECALLYPGNDDALAHNRGLRRPIPPSTSTIAAAKRELPAPAGTVAKDAPGTIAQPPKEAVDAFARSFSPPRTLTLDTRWDGAVSVDVWSGYAVQIVDKKGGRRVVRGPASVLLEWDESLESLSLSTGRPKTADKLLHTAFLQVSGNQVSDRVEVTSNDLVKCAVTLKYRVSFEGDPAAWFLVDNYVKLLCDHASSLIKAAARQTPIRKLRAEIAEIVRDNVLGKKGDAPRVGLAFTENGMRVTDVEVLDVDVIDDTVHELLDLAQLAAIKSAITVAEKESSFADKQRIEDIERALLRAEHETRTLKAELDAERDARASTVEEQRLRARAQLAQQKREAELLDAEQEGAVRLKKLEARAKETDADLDERARRQQLELGMLREHVEAAVRQGAAFSPELIAAVTRLGDAQLLSSLSANFGELAAVEGRGLLETARKFLDFVPNTSLPMLKPTKLAEREGDAE